MWCFRGLGCENNINELKNLHNKRVAVRNQLRERMKNNKKINKLGASRGKLRSLGTQIKELKNQINNLERKNKKLYNNLKNAANLNNQIIKESMKITKRQNSLAANKIIYKIENNLIQEKLSKTKPNNLLKNSQRYARRFS